IPQAGVALLHVEPDARVGSHQGAARGLRVLPGSRREDDDDLLELAAQILAQPGHGRADRLVLGVDGQYDADPQHAGQGGTLDRWSHINYILLDFDSKDYDSIRTPLRGSASCTVDSLSPTCTMPARRVLSSREVIATIAPRVVS